MVASSDWIFSDNMLSSNLSYMPFFRSAVSGTPARHYAVDTVRNEPGYFFALPIRDEQQEWRVIGVAVVKSSIREIERRWLAEGDKATLHDLADEYGVSAERIRQIEAKAMQKMKGMLAHAV